VALAPEALSRRVVESLRSSDAGIYLLSTGGTIEKVYSEQSGAVENRAAKLDRYLRALRLPDADIRTMQLMNKDSLEMTDVDRAEVRDRIAELLSEGAPS